MHIFHICTNFAKISSCLEIFKQIIQFGINSLPAFIVILPFVLFFHVQIMPISK